MSRRQSASAASFETNSRLRLFGVRKLLILSGMALIFASARIGVAADMPPLQPDELGLISTLPQQPGAHWIWVSDMVWIAMTDGRATLIDADTGTMLGMLSTGYSFNSLSIPRRYGRVYSAETYYTRYTRGERTDVVTIYDMESLSPVEEIEIPPKRMSTTPKLSTASLTDDDRFMAVYNYTPAQSLSIVDLEARKLVAEVPTPGCALAFPAGERKFFSLCGNGSLQMLILDDNGELADRRTSLPFFDVASDPITEKGVRLGDRWFFPSYAGVVHTVDLSGKDAAFPKTWSLLTPADRGESWRIGGIQHLAVHRNERRLYALMHQGEQDTHHHPGTQVWVYDLETRQRIQRIELRVPATSIEVSQDGAPLLYAVHPNVAELVVYDALSGEHLRIIPEVSITPSLLQLPVS